MIALRPWLDRLLLATLVVTTWNKLHWAPGAGDVTLEDILAAGFVGALHRRSLSAARLRMCTSVALGLLIAMGALVAVYLAGYFALENQPAALAVREGHGQVRAPLRVSRVPGRST